MMRKPFTLKDSRVRLAVVAGLIMFIFLGVVLRLLWVQIISGTELGKKATTQITGHIKKTAPRGKILDCNGEELAVSIMANTLIANPKEMVLNPKKKQEQEVPRDIKREAARLLAPALKMNEEELYKDFSLEGEYVRIQRLMEPKEYEAVAQIIKENKLPGLYFEQESKRYYTKKTMAAQVLGFVGEDDSGLSGLELALDGILKGALFYQEEKVDALGRPVAESSLMDKRPPKVSTVYLTIDSKMQFVVEDALDDAMKRTHAAGAAVIIMDPETGAILAMGSRPTFDPNNYGKSAPESWLNRGISMIYEPGSVFKPIMGCAGMSEGIISPDSPIQDNGSIQVADRTIRNWDGSGMGAIHFQDVIKYSINTGMVQLGLKLGADREIAYAKKFGFGKDTGIELPGEEDGILYNPKKMVLPDIATMAIGQGVAVTPLQMLRAICSIANGGELLQPYIIDKIVAPNGDIIRRGGKKVVRRVITEDVAAQMRLMMEKVVSEGGGKSAHIKGYRIAGKTGTAEKLSPNGGYAAGQYIASFVGFVPADKPKYAMLVMLDRPQGAFYGSQVSAPIFKDTLQQILVAKGVQPSIHEDLPSFNEHGGTAEPLAKTVPVLQQKGDKWLLPNLQGLDVRTISGILEPAKIRLVPVGSGISYQQEPAAGAEIPLGAQVKVWFH